MALAPQEPSKRPPKSPLRDPQPPKGGFAIYLFAGR